VLVLDLKNVAFFFKVIYASAERRDREKRAEADYGRLIRAREGGRGCISLCCPPLP
jgi:hypothetical protein